MKTILYTFIEDKLKGFGLKNFDWWNDQLATLETEDPFPVPAAFVEILPFTKRPLGRKRLEADVEFIIHYVTQPFERIRAGSKNQKQALEKLAKMDDVIIALKGKNNGSTIGSISCSDDIPDHKYEGYTDQRQQFKVRMYSDIATKPGIPAIARGQVEDLNP